MNQAIKVGLLIVVIANSGCSAHQPQDDKTRASSSCDMGVTEDVKVSGLAFNPITLAISPGSSVIWTNKDSAVHTVVSDSGNDIIPNIISQGEKYMHTFYAPVGYSYHCSVHPSMRGIIIVGRGKIPVVKVFL